MLFRKEYTCKRERHINNDAAVYQKIETKRKRAKRTREREKETEREETERERGE